MVLLSSTPHENLLYILERRGMKQYFQTIQGAPVNKADWISEYMTLHLIPMEAILFFGDTLEDAEAAKQASCSFVAVACNFPDHKNIQDFCEVKI
jgi:phosphoglycolate phosphatase-like HAD superfamily hydrolase